MQFLHSVQIGYTVARIHHRKSGNTYHRMTGFYKTPFSFEAMTQSCCLAVSHGQQRYSITDTWKRALDHRRQLCLLSTITLFYKNVSGTRLTWGTLHSNSCQYRFCNSTRLFHCPCFTVTVLGFAANAWVTAYQYSHVAQAPKIHNIDLNIVSQFREQNTP